MRVLVTGATGRIGRELVAALEHDPGIEIVQSSRTATTGVRLDIADHADVQRVVAEVRPDAIVHLAAVLAGECDRDEARAVAVNVDAVRALAAAAATAGVRRIVLASTAAVYGDRALVPLSESAPLAPSSLYGRTKEQAEVILGDAARAGGPQAVILRIFNVWGAGFPDSLATRSTGGAPGEELRFRGRSTFVRDYVHVDDVVRALAASVLAPLVDAVTTVNIGSGIATSNEALIARAELVGVPYTVTDGSPSYSVADIGRARALIGFDPTRAP
ncbi:NAD-dependent epimerase/dehydratase family protein [Marisediminicola senii]|uniref:NAD-dependent epimerase/dehydratase family protein n=1 Tax=Marisediminicola senii TaxID=2711233 RepID=UPI0013EDDD7C|nr:NAD-dependent epimerase/dehydratase family protein [Marisediminicola senii]